MLSNGKFDISKIPDIYDCIKYDLQHNRYMYPLYIYYNNLLLLLGY